MTLVGVGSAFWGLALVVLNTELVYPLFATSSFPRRRGFGDVIKPPGSRLRGNDRALRNG